MYDEDDSNPGDSTGAVINDLQYAYNRYISPTSEVSSRSYLRYQGRPVIFVFPKGQAAPTGPRFAPSSTSGRISRCSFIKTRTRNSPATSTAFMPGCLRAGMGWKPDGSNGDVDTSNIST